MAGKILLSSLEIVVFPEHDKPVIQRTNATIGYAKNL